MSEIPIGEQHIPESLTHKGRALCSPMRAFEPHPLLRNHHVATVAGAFWARKLSRLPAGIIPTFAVGPGKAHLAKRPWQEGSLRPPTLVLIHGPQRLSGSRFMVGSAEMGFGSRCNL